ncbi:hypothetical protein K505DRAFT_230102 [Melanomma pulvis-pyrius CBS 109.77]|uniref:Uncharacterized protein n=1 Tax=Melanomma pulvis-pyrius CBS 109.77 TaxID=1314802 RepID=A0A6A6XVR0_9PLEO|nr:hypothetical protein K505DRAFT_230102 [Melanomma pulvis-pyrius CBS 109.77]
MFPLALLTLLSTTAFASPLSPTPRQTSSPEPSIPPNWTWHVTGWHAGCARTCSYNFNVTVPTIANEIGGVKAYCSGYESGNTFTRCQILEGANNGVSAKFGPRDEGAGSPKEVFLSFEKGGFEERPPYNFTAKHEAVFNAFVAPLLDFDVTPTEVVAVV